MSQRGRRFLFCSCLCKHFFAAGGFGGRDLRAPLRAVFRAAKRHEVQAIGLRAREALINGAVSSRGGLSSARSAKVVCVSGATGWARVRICASHCCWTWLVHTVSRGSRRNFQSSPYLDLASATNWAQCASTASSLVTGPLFVCSVRRSPCACLSGHYRQPEHASSPAFAQIIRLETRPLRNNHKQRATSRPSVNRRFKPAAIYIRCWPS